RLNQFSPDRRLEHRMKHGYVSADRRGRQSLGGHLRDVAGDVPRPDLGEAHRSERFDEPPTNDAVLLDRPRFPATSRWTLLEPLLCVRPEGQRGRFAPTSLIDFHEAFAELSLRDFAGDAVPLCADRLHHLTTTGVGVLDPPDTAAFAVVRDDRGAPRHRGL